MPIGVTLREISLIIGLQQELWFEFDHLEWDWSLLHIFILQFLW